LDPAGPLFENYDPRVRLDPEDADLVDVIHSNGEKIYMGGLGAWDPMGDIDFYPNGGRMQKGCTNLFFGAVSDMFWCKFCHIKFYYYILIYRLENDYSYHIHQWGDNGKQNVSNVSIEFLLTIIENRSMNINSEKQNTRIDH